MLGMIYEAGRDAGGQVWNGGANLVNQGGEKLKQGGEYIADKTTDVVDVTVDTATDVVTEVADTASDVVDATIDTATDLGETVVDVATDVVETTTETAADIVDAAVDVGNDVVDAATDTGQAVADMITDAVDEIESRFTETVTGGVAAAVAIHAIMARFGGYFSPSNVADTVTNTAGDLGEAAGDLVDAATEKAGDLADTVSDAVAGAADTVVDTAQDIGDAAAAGGRATVDAVQGAVDSYNGISEENRELIHVALDIAGFVPVIGEVADVANGILYLMEGDYVNAGISFVSAIPVAGDTAKAGRAVTKGAKFADAAVSVYRAFEVANTAWTVADLSTRGLNVASTGKVSAASQGLSLAPALSLLGDGAGQLSSPAMPKGQLLDLLC
jgi:hypothetical protein